MKKLLLIRCGGMTAADGDGPTDCFETLEVPFDVLATVNAQEDDLGDTLFGFLKTRGWVLPIANPPGQDRVVLDPMCPACAVVCLPPEAVAEMRKLGLLPAETAA